jgi:hypothetical protein
MGTKWNADTKTSEPAMLHTARMYPVSDGSEENKKFFAATPCGSLELSTMNGQPFQAGKSYYVDFTPAD